MGDAEIVLSAREVSTHHGVCRVRPFSLELRRGDRILVRGRSGVGKSVLLSTLGLLSPPKAGDLRIMDRTAEGERASAELRRLYVSYVFQESLLVEHLTLRQNVRLMLGMEREDACVERIRAWGIDADRTQPASLSTGERQRVGLAIALTKRAAVVVADEPTSSVDAETRDVVIEQFEDLSRSSGVIVASHDPAWLPWATQVADLEDVG